MTLTSINSDTVIIRGLRTNASIGPDRWDVSNAQPITISVYVYTSVVKAGKSDDVADSINYWTLTTDILDLTNGATFANLLELAEAVAELSLKRDVRVYTVEVDARARNQFLQAEHLGVHIKRMRDGVAEIEARDDRMVINDLRVPTIIGVDPPEREAKQIVHLNLTFYGFDWSRSAWKETHATLVEVCCALLLFAARFFHFLKLVLPRPSKGRHT